jgi:hypothetical protein
MVGSTPTKVTGSTARKTAKKGLRNDSRDRL